MPEKLTTEEFIIKAKLIQGNLYDYSLVEYKGSKIKIKIICKIHGVFEQSPNHHLKNQGCFECYGTPRLNKDQFIEKSKEVHGNLYDYSQIEYINNHTKIKIICLEHGMFEQKPNNHIFNQQGCPECGGNKKLTTEEFIKRANVIHDNKYDYSLVDYKGSKIKVKIICKDHGIFEQISHDHLNHIGCAECAGVKKPTTEEFVKKAKEVHGTKYDYSLVDYKKISIKIKIICPIHGEFKQTPNNHLRGQNCPYCASGPISKMETEWLDSLNIPKQNRNKPVYINSKKFIPDAIDTENKIIWEFFGDFWHGNPELYEPNEINSFYEKSFQELYQETIDRLKLFRENGYKVIYIWENEFKNLLKSIPEII